MTLPIRNPALAAMGGRWFRRAAVDGLIAAAIGLCATVATPGPANAGPAEGELLARQWCAACHVVADDQKASVEGVPSFADIAGRLDDDAIRGVLFQPHPPMPEFDLSRRSVDDLIAYIRSRAG
jgi:mono/diheme cytochrome c family protein